MTNVAIPGSLPAHWQSVSMKWLLRFRNGADYGEVVDDSGAVPVIGSGGEFARASAHLFDGESVLFGRKGTVDRPLHIDGRFWTVDTMYYTELGSRIVGRFLYYFATTIPYNLLSTSTALPSMTQATLGAVKVPLPPKDEQRAIADFLDRETAQIDAMVDAQERLVTLLEERLDAGWSRYFDELGQASPSLPVRRVIASIVDGPFGSSLTSAHYSDAGTRVIRLGNIGVNEFKDLDKAYVPDDYARELDSHSAAPGDVVVAGLGDERMPLGRAAVVPDIGPAIVKADCYRVRPNALVTSSYLAWAMSAPPAREQIALLARGSTRQRLNTTIVRDVTIPVPSLSEQRRVVSAHQEHFAETRSMIEKAQTSIALMKERRAAVISAAVTGRIDVWTGIEQVERDLEEARV